MPQCFKKSKDDLEHKQRLQHNPRIKRMQRRLRTQAKTTTQSNNQKNTILLPKAMNFASDDNADDDYDD